MYNINNTKKLKDDLKQIENKMNFVSELIEELTDTISDISNNLFIPCNINEDEIEERWISPTNFFLQTDICSSGMVGTMFRKDPIFFALCGMRKGKKYYIKKEAALDYLKKYSEGRILNNTLRYLKRREEDNVQQQIKK